jgi:vesicle coat complex subunit
MIHIRGVQREDLIKQLVRKMAPPLVTLLSSPPEVQWVALRNINLLLQKRPEILANEMRVFFCKYNDPLYVKVEKLDIMVRLAAENNVDALLSELKEWVFASYKFCDSVLTVHAGTRQRSTWTLCARVSRQLGRRR